MVGPRSVGTGWVPPMVGNVRDHDSSKDVVLCHNVSNCRNIKLFTLPYQNLQLTFIWIVVMNLMMLIIMIIMFTMNDSKVNNDNNG